MVDTRLEVTGETELNKVLNTLQVTTANRVAKRMLRKSTGHVARKIRSQATVGTKGHSRTGYRSIVQSIGSRLKKGRRRGMVEAKAGMQVGSGYKKGVKHAQMFAMGSKERYVKQGRFQYSNSDTRRGRMPKNELVRRGFEAALPALPAMHAAGFKKGIEAEARRLAKRSAKGAK
jgi:hypothetical protein